MSTRGRGRRCWRRRTPGRTPPFSRFPPGRTASALSTNKQAIIPKSNQTSNHPKIQAVEIIREASGIQEEKKSQEYPEAAPGGAAIAADAVDPKEVAAGVHLHVVALGRCSDLNPREVQSALRRALVRRAEERAKKKHTGVSCATTGLAGGARARRRGRSVTYPVSVGRPTPPRGRSTAPRSRP